jgi:predicted acyl esterase
MSEEHSLKENKRNLSGYQLMVAGEVFRGRFRHSFAKPEPIPADQVQTYKFSLHGHDHVFRKGHKIMVQVQSAWFPVIDRNPQKFVENIFSAADADYSKATQRIFRSKAAASGVILPVMHP